MVKKTDADISFDVEVKYKFTPAGIVQIPVYSAQGLKGVFYPEKMILKNDGKIKLTLDDIRTLEDVFCTWRTNNWFWPAYVARYIPCRGIAAYHYYAPQDLTSRIVPADAYENPEKYYLARPFRLFVERKGLKFTLERFNMDIAHNNNSISLLEEEVAVVEKLLQAYRNYRG